MNRIRYIILGRSGLSQKVNTNAEAEPSEEVRESGTYLVAEVLKTAKIGVVDDKLLDISFSESLSDASSVQSSSQNMMTLPPVPEQIEDDGVEYLSGYVAFKLRQKFPELGAKTRTLAAALGPLEDHQMLLKPTFVEALSYHGLTKPSPSWLRATKKIHKLFDKYHPENGFKTGKFLTKRLVNKIMSKNPNFCEPAVKLYIRQRLLARVKKFNRKLALKPPSNQKKTPVQKKLVKMGATITQI
jgi:87kDa Transposase